MTKMRTTSVNPKRVFAYIIRTVNSRYGVTGCVPCVEDGRVFFGPCKRLMRPEVLEGDYVMGISGSAAPKPRRVLLWMRAKQRLTFREAWERGDIDPTFRKLRGGAIHIRPRQGADILASPEMYEHIPGSPHWDDWESDISGDRDVFLLGDPKSWLVAGNGPEVTPELVECLQSGITWKGQATVENPLTRNARGKHVLLSGKVANQIIRWVPRLKTDVKGGRNKSACKKSCSCE